MASKPRAKTKSPTPAGSEKQARRSAKSRASKNKGNLKAEAEATFAFKVLSSSQTKDLIELDTVDDVQAKLAEVMDTPSHVIELKDAILLDYYTGALWWGREQGFTVEQLSAFFTVVHLLVTNIQEKQLTLLENLKELKHLVTGMGPEGTEIPTGGLADYFTTDQLKLITDYTYTSVFQHYKMFEFVFSTNQAEEIVGTDMNVEIAPSADIPWPPPLEEAVEENTHKEYAEETGTSPRQESELKGDKAVEAITSVEIESTEVETELSEKHKDILSQLTTEEIRAVMTSVMDEMVQGVQDEVAQKLREKEEVFLNRINKLQRPDEKK